MIRLGRAVFLMAQQRAFRDMVALSDRAIRGVLIEVAINGGLLGMRADGTGAGHGSSLPVSISIYCRLRSAPGSVRNTQIALEGTRAGRESTMQATAPIADIAAGLEIRHSARLTGMAVTTSGATTRPLMLIH
jgi:hypothetical protein